MASREEWISSSSSYEGFCSSWKGVGNSRDRLTLTKRYLETTTIEKLAIWVNTVAAAGSVSRFIHGRAHADPRRVRKFNEYSELQWHTYILLCIRPLPAVGGSTNAKERKRSSAAG